MATDKRTKYRAKMGEQGLVQANEWVPRDQRPLFKAVAQALRDGVPVTIGEVPRDSGPAPSVDVHRDPDPAPSVEVPRDYETPRTVEELLARKGRPKARPTTPKDPEIASKAKAAHQARQERYAAEWASATERLRVVDPNGKGHEARITRREMRGSPDLFGNVRSFQHIEGLILKGRTFQTMAYSLWPDAGIRPIKPSCWRFVPDSEITRMRREVSALHPDKGGPGGAEFMAAKAILDRLVGRV